MRLDPLTEPAMRELLAGSCRGCRSPSSSAILARADGIPLYAVETVRMLLADGRLVVEDGVYRPVRGPRRHRRPADAPRARRLAPRRACRPADRRLLQDAAVLGQSFIARRAGRRQRRRAGRPRAPPARPRPARDPRRGDGPASRRSAASTRFIQAIIREVAYGTLSKRERRARHLAAARYFETLDDQELAGALATHYLAA